MLFQLIPLYLSLKYSTRLGSLSRDKIFDERIKTLFSNQKWINMLTRELVENVDKMNNIAKLKPVLFDKFVGLKYGNYYTDSSVECRKPSKQAKAGVSNLEKIYRVLDTNLYTLGSFQKLSLDQYTGKELCEEEYTYVLERALLTFENFRRLEVDEDIGMDTHEQHRFKILIDMVYTLSKIQRFDILKKYSKVKCFRNTFINDPVGIQLIDRVQTLIEAIELYQCNHWEKAVYSYLKFMNDNTEILKETHWIRIFETTWYLAIVTFWSSKYSIYLPVNTLNYVHENAEVIETEGGHDERYQTVLEYERQINLPEISSKEPNRFFIRMLKNFEIM